MKKVLAYCAFLDKPGVSRPESGVGGAAVEEISRGELRLLWSEVEWPFDSSALQRHALEFHGVVSHIFSQTAVAPFRLLSVFEDRESLEAFLTRHHIEFAADLKRLQSFVQMECVLYVGREAANAASGKAYLELKAGLLRGVENEIQKLRQALNGLSHGITVKESKNGSRIFVLVERGREQEFISRIKGIPLPERLERRTSGPWPAAQFLSDAVKSPQEPIKHD
jgi:hypothetical protein